MSFLTHWNLAQVMQTMSSTSTRPISTLRWPAPKILRNTNISTSIQRLAATSIRMKSEDIPPTL